MKKTLPIFGLLITLTIFIYLESPYSFMNEKHVRYSSIPYEVLLADAQAELEAASVDPADQSEEGKEETTEESAETLAHDYSLEMILEGKSEVDGYIVETYREHEVYRDQNGEIIKTVPTSNYDYLRYYEE
jgi:hypothetical protein